VVGVDIYKVVVRDIGPEGGYRQKFVDRRQKSIAIPDFTISIGGYTPRGCENQSC
jgi:hypothetical protein